MKKLLFYFIIINNFLQAQSITFTENKGQVSDQNYKSRPDVLFSGSKNGMVFHLRNNGISYQLNRIDSWKEEEDFKTKQKRKVPDQSTIYRLDINWLGINTNFTTHTEKPKNGYNNYYLEVCPNGATNVKTFEGVFYNNIYNNINLHYYQKNGALKYDYIVAPGGDYKQIQLQINGAQHIKVKKDGSLIFTTPLGIIQEGAPLVYQNNKPLKAKWIVKNNILSFAIENYNPNIELIIDPVTRLWGTYYGDFGYEEGMSCTTSTNGCVYIAGRTGSTAGIATVGSHQSSFGGGDYDAYLVKFDANGLRQWSTYYGGAGTDIGTSCASDISGNIYLVGGTGSNTGTVIGTNGSHQPTFGGGNYDAFLVKFDSAGLRQWGTYYGGGGNDILYSCVIAVTGDIYTAGLAQLNNGPGIATAGSHQPLFGGSDDAFLVKFNANGVRQWGTFYGGSGGEIGYSCALDSFGNVYLAGKGDSNSVSAAISTPGCHQLTNGGGIWDAFLVKFNSNGVRQWGTYYGGLADDKGLGCITDALGCVYLAGHSASSTGTVIATLGSHQPLFGGAVDAFLVKFDSSGVRLWGTYYGGTLGEYANSCITDINNNVYLVGQTGTNSGTAIATVGSYQTTYGGPGADAFLVQFNSSGVRNFGTYYGGISSDFGISCAIDVNGYFYLAGYTYSGNGTSIATATSFQPFYSWDADAFLTKFDVCINAPSHPAAIYGNTTICSGTINSYSIAPIIGANSYNWSLPSGWTGTSTTNIITTTVNSTGGNIIVSASNSCGTSSIQTLSVTLNTIPTMPNPISGLATLCANSSAINYSVVPVAGATSYIWNLSGGWTGSSTSNIISALPGNSAGLSASAINSCGSSAQQIIYVTVNPNPTITVSNGVICQGNSFTILPSGASTYTYSSGSIVSPILTSTYSITGTDGNGCVSSNTAICTVTVNPLPTITVNSGSICLGNSFTLTPNGATTYTFSSGSSVVTPTSNITYSITGASPFGCISSNPAISNVTVNPLPIINASTNTSLLCTGQTATLTANGATTYSWSTGGTSNTEIVTPTITTSYTVNGTDVNGCNNVAIVTQSVGLCNMVYNQIRFEDNIYIFPNPTSGLINVECKTLNESGLKIEIISSLGQVVFRLALNDIQSKININYLPAGIYFLKVGSKIRKIVKE